MRIEKVNDNQIRCTLTREDLEYRQLKLSELAYGTEKAKSLFREMMQQASYEFGFEAEDIPLMIEAIPLSSEAVILIITKVDCPEELDTRFSKFSEPSEDYEDFSTDSYKETISEGADDILDIFGKKAQPEQSEKDFVPLKDAIAQKQQKDAAKDIPVSVPADITKLFSFKDMDTICELSRILCSFYDGDNTLYKKPNDAEYFLLISKGLHTPEDFNKVCNILSEFSHQLKYLPAAEAYMREHYDVILAGSAIQVLAKL